MPGEVRAEVGVPFSIDIFGVNDEHLSFINLGSQGVDDGTRLLSEKRAR